MPPEAISLALAASIYPPALAVVIALGRGAQVRLRVLLLVVAAFLTVLLTGLLMLLLFNEAAVTSRGAARSAPVCTSPPASGCFGSRYAYEGPLPRALGRSPAHPEPTVTWRAHAWCWRSAWSCMCSRPRST